MGTVTATAAERYGATRTFSAFTPSTAAARTFCGGRVKPAVCTGTASYRVRRSR